MPLFLPLFLLACSADPVAVSSALPDPPRALVDAVETVTDTPDYEIVEVAKINLSGWVARTTHPEQGEVNFYTDSMGDWFFIGSNLPAPTDLAERLNEVKLGIVDKTLAGYRETNRQAAIEFLEKSP